MLNLIANLVSKFANSFDLKKWDVMESCFTEKIDCDYTSLRGRKETLTAKEYVNQRRSSLEALQTQHLFSNLEIDFLNKKKAICRCSALILRRRGDQFFNTHAIYEFTCVNEQAEWLISAIKQIVLWNEGNPEIHFGVTEKCIATLSEMK